MSFDLTMPITSLIFYFKFAFCGKLGFRFNDYFSNENIDVEKFHNGISKTFNFRHLMRPQKPHDYYFNAGNS